jgi:hypothetical protein
MKGKDQMSNNNVMKQGKKPLASRPKPGGIKYDDLFGNNLALSPEMQKELDEKGLVGRFVDAKKLFENGGYHPKGWVPYRREKKSGDILDKDEFRFGSDPSGVIRRGSVILAVKRKEEVEKHREFLKQRAALYNPQTMQDEKAEELRRFSKTNRLDTVIHEGFEENDGDGGN